MDGRAKHLLESTVEESVTPETAMDAGFKIGQVYKSVSVIIDSDSSSLMIANALMAGLLSAGAEVTFAGNVPVPVAHTALNSVILSVGNPDLDGTISGIKVYNPDGSPFTWDQLYDILKSKRDILPDYRSVNQIKTITDANRTYIEKLKEIGIRSEGYVILDCNCGSTSGCAPQLLTNLGTKTEVFNAHVSSGNLPHSPELTKNNLSTFSNFVNASIGSIGIAFNGDGTRIVVMDEEGDYIPGSRLLALMLMYLEPDTAVIPFDSPCIVEDAFKNPLKIIDKDRKVKRRLIRSKNDIHSLIKTMQENDADFGALNDGTFIFPALGYCPDALYAATVISALAGVRSIRNLLKEIPIYSSRVVKIDFDGNIRLFSNKLRERIKEYDIAEACTSNEQWKMILKNGTYIIKQSEMDPNKLVIFAESSDTVYLITMLEQAKDIIGLCI